MSSVPNRPNVKLAKLWYKYRSEPRQKAEENVEDVAVPQEKKDYEAYPPVNFSWFIENKIAAMGFPQTVENLNYLADVGVNHLVTLSPERIPPILECEKKLKWSEIRIKEFGVPTLKQILKFIEICERAEIRGEISSDDILCVECIVLLQNWTSSTTTIPCISCSWTPQHMFCLWHVNCKSQNLISQDCPQRNVMLRWTPAHHVVGVHCRQGRGRTGTLLACYLVHFQGMAPERAVLTVRVKRPGSCETYGQEKAVCYYHDCLRGTIEKPDYRLADDKLYFDFSMKYMYNDDDISFRKKEKTADTTEIKDGDDWDHKIINLGDPKSEKHVKIKLPKKKTNAMVINHKIYF